MYKINISKEYYNCLKKIEEEVLDISAGPFLLETVIESIAQNNERRPASVKVSKNQNKAIIFPEEMIKRLKAVNREVFTLICLESKSVEETAQTLGIKEIIVCKRTASALNELFSP